MLTRTVNLNIAVSQQKLEKMKNKFLVILLFRFGLVELGHSKGGIANVRANVNDGVGKVI